MMEKRIKTAIIGYGRSGQLLHGTALRANAEFEVVAVCDRSETSLQQAKDDFGCAVFTNYREMLQTQPLDLVVIITRSDQHCFMAVDCLNAGANVMVTKPMGISTEEVRQIQRATEANQRAAIPFMPSRWGSDFRRIREVIAAGTIGDVFCVRRAVFGFALRNDWQTQRQYGGGILLNWGPHLLDLPVALVDGQPLSVFGTCSQLLNGGDAEDNYFAVIQLDGGIRVHSEWSFAPTGLPNWFVQGTRGCIIVHDRHMEVISGAPTMPDDPTNFRAMAGTGHDRFQEELGEHIYGDSIEVYADLAVALNGGGNFAVGIEDALQTAILIDAVKQSQASQSVIKVAPCS